MSSTTEFPPTDVSGGNSAEARGERLVRIRGNEAQASFASKIGAHKNTYGHWERGRTDVSAAALAELVVLGWNANWLLTGEGPERLDDLQSKGSQPATTVDLDVMQEAVEGTLEIIQRTGRKPDLPGMARIISLLYAEFLVGPDPERPVAEVLARLAAEDGGKSA